VSDDNVHLAAAGQLHELAGTGAHRLNGAHIRVLLLELAHQLVDEARVAHAGGHADDKLVAAATRDR
jgi:hypothetical protein